MNPREPTPSNRAKGFSPVSSSSDSLSADLLRASAEALTIWVELNGVGVPVVLDDAALDALADRVAQRERPPEPASPFMTIKEAAVYIRAPRQRVDDLCSQGRLERVKDGTRTLIARRDLDAYLSDGSRKR